MEHINGKPLYADWLMCDFHIHTTRSDGSLSLREVVDLYGQFGFDAICISDHCLDQKSMQENSSWAVNPNKFQAYLRALWKEGQRAWTKY